MHNIVVIPTPVHASQISIQALQCLQKATHVVLRIEQDSILAILQEHHIAYHSLESIYQNAEDYDDFHAQVANYLLELTGDIAYVVPDPAFDNSVKYLQKKANVQILSGANFREEVLAQLQTQGASGVYTIPASELLLQNVHAKQNMLVTELGDTLLAGDVKLLLCDAFGDEYPITLFTLQKQNLVQSNIALYELDMQQISAQSAIYIQGSTFSERNRYSFEDLQDIVAVLRAPGGCPWDRKQTHETLRSSMIEEAHEVVGAITKNSMPDLCEELGDVLLQVVLHENIAKQKASFSMQDITSEICEKMIRRHTHIFGDVVCNTAEEVLQSWEAVKQQEKGQESISQSMQEIETHIPTLMRADKVQAKAAKVGFDFENATQAAGKITEELQEVLDAMQGADTAHLEEEIGDLLFAVVNVARLLKVDAELALHLAVDKFVLRFKTMENLVKNDKKSLNHLTLQELDVYWNIGKAVLKG